MAKQIKEKNYKIQIVNVKLLSDKRSDASAYEEIFRKIKKDKISIPVKGGKKAILRLLLDEEYSYGNKNYKVLYGKFSKFTVIDGKDWIDIDTMEKENVTIPPNKYPNLAETDYIFIPAAHRFAIVLNGKVKINAVEQFLKEAIKKAIDSDEDCEVIVEQSEDIFEQIAQAKEIHKLFIRISYTNADTGDDAFDFMDSQLKESQIARLSIDASSDRAKNINTKSKLISGALGVAKSNGFAEATIVTNGKRATIDTKKHPKTITLASEESLIGRKVFDTIMKLFRDNGGKSKK